MRSTITRRSSHSRNVRSAARFPAVKEKQDVVSTITYRSLSSNATPPLSRLTDKSIATAKLPVGNSALSPFCICCIGTFWRKQKTMTNFLFSSLLIFTKVFLSSFRLYSFIFVFTVRDIRIFTRFILLPPAGGIWRTSGNVQDSDRKSRRGPKSSLLPESRGTMEAWIKSMEAARRSSNRMQRRISMHRADRSQYKHSEATAMAKSNFKHLRDSDVASWESIIRPMPVVFFVLLFASCRSSSVSLPSTLPSCSLSHQLLSFFGQCRFIRTADDVSRTVMWESGSRGVASMGTPSTVP